MPQDKEGKARTLASAKFYRKNIHMIDRAFGNVFGNGSSDRQPKRVFITGDSLMKQIFIAMACNAVALYDGLIEHVEINWKDEWLTPGCHHCKITGE